MGINKVAISGNLTRDPETRATAGGTQVMSFGVAVNDRRKNPQTGDWEDYPNFVDCTMFGARAEKIAPYLSKGTKVAIEGKLRYSSWERDGQKRSKIEVIVDEIEFMSRRGSADAEQPDPMPGSPGTLPGDAAAGIAARRTGPYAPPQGARRAPSSVQRQVDAAISEAARAGAQQVDLYDEDIPF